MLAELCEEGDRFFHEEDERQYSETERLALKPFPHKLNAAVGSWFPKLTAGRVLNTRKCSAGSLTA